MRVQHVKKKTENSKHIIVYRQQNERQ